MSLWNFSLPWKIEAPSGFYIAKMLWEWWWNKALLTMIFWEICLYWKKISWGYLRKSLGYLNLDIKETDMKHGMSISGISATLQKKDIRVALQRRWPEWIIKGCGGVRQLENVWRAMMCIQKKALYIKTWKHKTPWYFRANEWK